MAYPVPVQDWQRLADADGVKPLAGPEARTIFLGFDQIRDELLYSNVKGKNPLKDLGSARRSSTPSTSKRSRRRSCAARACPRD